MLRERYLYSANKVYFRYVNSTINTDFYATAFGYEKCDKKKPPQGPVIKENHSIHYIISGKGYFRLEGKLHKLAAGDIFYFPPSFLGTYFQDKSTPWEYIWFECNGSSAKKLFSRAFFTPENPTYHIDDEDIYNNLSDMLETCYLQVNLDIYCISHLYKFFSQLIQSRSDKSIIDVENRKSNLIQKVTKYIDENFARPELGLSSISSNLFVNASYLSRTYKELMGITISNYITIIRIRKACELLEDKRLEIKTIALSVGYTDPLYFSRVFKKHMNLPPTHYKSIGTLL